MTTPPTPPGARGSKLSQRLGRLLLLAVVLVGVLGGWQLYQISLATQTYAVRVRPEPNVYGETLRTVLQPEDLVERLQVRIALRDGTLLAQLPAGEDSGTLQTKGRAQRDAVRKGQLDVVLRVPQTDADRLALSGLDVDTEDDTLQVTLPRDAARSFLESDAVATFAIRTEEGDAREGVEDVGGYLEPAEGEPGVYALSLSVDELLVELWGGERGYPLYARDGDTPLQLEVPLEWFLRRGENHVLTVQTVVADTPEVLPMVDSFSPRHAVIDRWDGQINLRGRDLDLVEEVWLEGGGRRRPAPVVARRIDGLMADAGTLPPGTYRIGIGWRDQTQILAGRLVVAASYALVAPAAGTSVVRGDDLNVRWQSPPGAGSVVIEATSHPAEGAWLEVFRGDASRQSVAWSTASLTAEDEGPLHLRVTWPEDAQAPTLERTLRLVAPPKVAVRLRFKLDGREYGMINSIRIDGEPVPVGADPVLVPVSLERGPHRIQAEAPLLDPYTGTFEVTDEGQIIDIELR
jgi:hypothetical protein